MYSIQAVITLKTPDGYQRSRQVPTFYLDPATQGILNTEGAERIARDILASSHLDPFGNGFEIHVTAFEV